MCKARRAERYLDALMIAMKGLFDSDLISRDEFFGGNSLDFLGLSMRAHADIIGLTGADPKHTPLGRMEAFYRRANASAKWERMLRAFGHA
jgi:hypothetical protein